MVDNAAFKMLELFLVSFMLKIWEIGQNIEKDIKSGFPAGLQWEFDIDK